MSRLIFVKWHLDPDGGGEAIVAFDKKSHVDEVKYVFDGLDRTDQLPARIAEMIRDDGRRQGELPRDPDEGEVAAGSA